MLHSRAAILVRPSGSEEGAGVMASLRSFLKQEPVPALLVCEYADEDLEPKKVRLGESRSRYRDAELSCKGAVRVEALDADGNTLRVWETEDAPQQEASAVVTKSAAAPTASGPDSQLHMLTTIARLLVEASDASATRHAEAYQLAYQQQALMVEVITTRLAQLETAWQQSLMVRAEEIDEAAEEAEAAREQQAPADPNAQMITTLLQGAVMSQMAGAANGGGNKS
jgi:hypothetical protein